MDIQRQFPGVHWIWGGGISYVYEVHPTIVVKLPKEGDFEREQFQKEARIYEIFSRQPRPCPSVVQCFYRTDNGIFLEYMRGAIPVAVDRHLGLTASVSQICLCLPGYKTIMFEIHKP